MADSEIMLKKIERCMLYHIALISQNANHTYLQVNTCFAANRSVYIVPFASDIVLLQDRMKPHISLWYAPCEGRRNVDSFSFSFPVSTASFAIILFARPAARASGTSEASSPPRSCAPHRARSRGSWRRSRLLGKCLRARIVSTHPTTQSASGAKKEKGKGCKQDSPSPLDPVSLV